MNPNTYNSRLQRKQDRLTKRQIYLFMAASVALVLLVVFYGLPLLFGLTSQIALLRKSAPDSSGERIIAPNSPRLVQEYSATASASLKVNGYADGRVNVELFQNDRSLGTQISGMDGKFSFDTDLEKGPNKFVAVAISDKGTKSDPSETYLVTYADKPPKLELSVNDGDNFKDNPVTISGKTDSSATVVINDHLVVVGGDGSFNYPFNLQNGDNKIKIVATDQAGNKSEKELTLKFNP